MAASTDFARLVLRERANAISSRLTASAGLMVVLQGRRFVTQWWANQLDRAARRVPQQSHGTLAGYGLLAFRRTQPLVVEHDNLCHGNHFPSPAITCKFDWHSLLAVTDRRKTAVRLTFCWTQLPASR